MPFDSPVFTTHYGFRFLLAVLAVWRLTHFLSKEDGPWDLVRGFRHRLGEGVWGRLVSCFYCLSLWVSVPFTLFVGGSVWEMLAGWWALSGGAVLLERATREPFEITPEEDERGVLRSNDARAADAQAERHR